MEYKNVGKPTKIHNMTFYNTDCQKILEQTPDNYYDLAIVDPPYGIGADENQEELSNKKGFTKKAGTYKKYHKTEWDRTIPSKS